MTQRFATPFGFDGICRSARRACWALVLLFTGLSCADVAEAALFLRESFDYTSGLTLSGRSGGTGWSAAWSGDSEPVITATGLGYTDTNGNVLTAAGNAVRNSTNALKKGERTQTSTFGTNGTSIWLSVIITGATGGGTSGRQANIALADKFFIGQGSNAAPNTDWTMSDQTGLRFDSNIVAGGVTDFLVALIEFNSGDETAWMWRDPILSATPAKSSALNGLAGTSIKDFTFDKMEVYLNRNNDGIVDEIRVGSLFDDVAPHAAVPEPGGILFGVVVCGVIGLAVAGRRVLLGRRNA